MTQNEKNTKLLYLEPMEQLKAWGRVFFQKNSDNYIDETTQSSYLSLKRLLEARITIAKL